MPYSLRMVMTLTFKQRLIAALSVAGDEYILDTVKAALEPTNVDNESSDETQG